MMTITYTSDQEQVFKDAVSVYGEFPQLTQTNEECTELSLAILKYQRALANRIHDPNEVHIRRQEMISEIADVIVMTQQCILLFGIEEIEQEVKRKLRRQRIRIDKKLNGIKKPNHV